jgi:DNA-binding HxlR family transcriptional regulator
MTRTSLQDHHCSLARTADIIGDKWALMILRDAFYGVRSFSAFQSGLGIAKTVLSDRLQRLTDGGILERVQAREGVERYEYRLTEAGRDMFPIVIALVQWGDRWIFGAGQEPMQIVDRSSGAPVRPVSVQSRDGEVLTPRQVSFAQPPA